MTDEIETNLADLRGVTLAELCAEREDLELYRQTLLGQVEKPRPNIGSGPPGRAD